MVSNGMLGYLTLLPTHHVAHLVNVGIPNLIAASAGGLMGAFLAVSALFGGWAADRWGVAKMSVLAGVALGVGIMALIAANPGAMWLVVLYVVGGGFGRGSLGVSTAIVQSRSFAGPRPRSSQWIARSRLGNRLLRRPISNSAQPRLARIVWCRPRNRHRREHALRHFDGACGQSGDQAKSGQIRGIVPRRICSDVQQELTLRLHSTVFLEHRADAGQAPRQARDERVAWGRLWRQGQDERAGVGLRLHI